MELQLADLERRFQRGQAEALMEAGVRLADPARLDLRDPVLIAQGQPDVIEAFEQAGRKLGIV